jgi:hypothetical protein
VSSIVHVVPFARQCVPEVKIVLGPAHTVVRFARVPVFVKPVLSGYPGPVAVRLVDVGVCLVASQPVTPYTEFTAVLRNTLGCIWWAG